MNDDISSIKSQISNMVKKKYGRTEENLMSSGIIDSLTAVEFSLEIEKAFQLNIDDLKLSDMTTVSTLSDYILKTMQLNPEKL